MNNPVFINHEVVNASPDDYVEIMVAPSRLLDAWAQSMFACEMLSKNGDIKPVEEMHEDIREKFLTVKKVIEQGGSVTKPVIGIGLMDNIEIGIGREISVALYAGGVAEMPVHVRKAQAKDVQKLLQAL